MGTTQPPGNPAGPPPAATAPQPAAQPQPAQQPTAYDILQAVSANTAAITQLATAMMALVQGQPKPERKGIVEKPAMFKGDNSDNARLFRNAFVVYMSENEKYYARVSRRRGSTWHEGATKGNRRRVSGGLGGATRNS